MGLQIFGVQLKSSGVVAAQNVLQSSVA
jgi:hypothetical protein